MTTDPGDLVLDPTCGAGTTAYVAEQWGRRWITIDTSRVALALARARVMGARYPYYLLADSPEGRQKEAELSRKAPSESPTRGAVRQGFVYERVPHITLKSIANNAEIDVIFDNHQATLEPLRQKLNKALKQKWEEWEIPRDAEAEWPRESPAASCPVVGGARRTAAGDRRLHRRQGGLRTPLRPPLRGQEARPRGRPVHRGEPVTPPRPGCANGTPGRGRRRRGEGRLSSDWRRETRLRRHHPRQPAHRRRPAGAQGRQDRLHRAHPLARRCRLRRRPLPGRRRGDGSERRAGIFVGPEFGTVSRPDLVDAAREAAEAGFDVLIACAFNYDAGASEFAKLGALSVLKARMNADLHMAEDLKNTGKGNLFVVFGEPDIAVEEADGGQLRVRVHGVDVYHPGSGDIRSDNADGIACWFVDTDYNGESFFVRHAYFLGANATDPYKSLKTTLKAEIDADAWNTLYSDVSRPFEKPTVRADCC